jgi:ammonium transporter, Amt family
VAINTTIGAATGAIACLFFSMGWQYFTMGIVVWDLLIAGNGALGGLVAITGGAPFFETWSCVITGLIGGVVYFLASKVNLSLLKVDDPLDAIAVHAGCGAWGMVATAVFASPDLVSFFLGAHPDGSDRANGFIYGRSSKNLDGKMVNLGGNLLAAHIIYTIVIAAWAMGIMVPFFFVLKKLGQFRVPPEVEVAGLDVSHHGGSAYPREKADAAGVDMSAVDVRIEAALSKMRAELKADKAL